MSSAPRWLAAIPVYNEVAHVDAVLDEVRRYAENVLVVDDGSVDGTSEKLANRKDVIVVRHQVNRGYGAALKTAFQYTLAKGYQGVVTLDCDGQHQPKRIPQFIEAAGEADIVSGSRYLKQYAEDNQPPAERLVINRRITAELNRRLGLQLTDAFCGFKAYRAEAIGDLQIEDDGYAMPLELWVQAASLGLRIVEIPVPLIYLDLSRSFGGALDHAESRLAYYNQVIDAACAKVGQLPRTRGQRQSLCQQSHQ